MDTKFTVREELNNLISAIAEINNELKAMHNEIEILQDEIYSKPPN